jgi:hypothetical protein
MNVSYWLSDDSTASEVLWEDGERILSRKRRNASEGSRNSVLVVSRPHIATGHGPADQHHGTMDGDPAVTHTYWTGCC